jgi:MtrB/PioB family decaheme-associated outer membrane protein
MKRNKKYQLQLALSACLLMPAANAVLAEEKAEAPDTSNWACKFCVVPYGWFGDLDVGVIYVDDPTPKFADYRGLIDDGAYADLGGEGGYRGEQGHYFDYYAKNLALDSRILTLDAGKQGTYDFRGIYQEIPRYLGHETFTPFQGVGSDTLVIPDGWSPSPDAPLDYAKLESKRTITGLGLTFRAFSNWRFDLDYERQEKDGTKTGSGGVFFLNAVLFPTPLNYSTDRFDAAIEYVGRAFQIRAEYMGSEFDNGYSSVTWDNPIALGFGDEISRTALEPDNEYQQFSLVGAIRFTDWLRFSGKIASGEAEQNDLFLPYSINPDYSDRPLPRESLDGKLETSVYNLAGRLHMRLSRGLDLTASYKASERDNKTPVDVYEPVVFEMYPRGPRSNRPYGYERSLGKVELRWRPTYSLRFNVGVANEEIERTYQEVLKTDEDGLFGEVQWSPFAVLDVRLRYEGLERDASMSEQQGNYDRAEHPLMRKYNMANRDRTRSTIQVDLMPTDRMSISFTAYGTDDDYTESLIGLQESEESSVSLDFNYLFANDTNIYAFYTDETIKAVMAGAGSETADPWSSNTDDNIVSWGAGITGRINEKWTYGFDYVSSDSDGEILTNDGNAEAPFPVLTTEMRNIRLYVDWDINERWGLGFEAYNETYDTADWMVDGVGPYSIDGMLTMGEVSPDYDVNVFRITATYRL